MNRSKPTSALERNLLGVRASDAPRLLPGLLLVGALAWLSIWLGEFLGTELLGFDKSPLSPVMLAILLGILLRTGFRLPAAAQPGLSFAVKKVLRLGIILLGIRLTIFDVLQLGVFGIPIVVVCILGALLITNVVNRWVGLPRKLGTLIAAGTAICGVSAIVATAPAIEADEKETAYAVTVITVFGLLATLLYPYLVFQLFGGKALHAGLFLGTAVHDTSQVVGSARVYADVYGQTLALDAATITKLVRNVFMAVVIPLMALLHFRSQGGAGTQVRPWKLFPLFVLGFLTVAVLRSLGDASLEAGVSLLDGEAWDLLIQNVRGFASTLLVVALAGVGLSTDLRSFRGLGIKPFFVGLGAALAVGAVSFMTINLLGDLVSF